MGFDLPVFSLLRAKMDWLQARQGTLASNVANANTPGYEAQDLKAPDFKKFLRGEISDQANKFESKRTHPAHIPLGRGGTSRSLSFDEVNKPDSEGTPNGNTVVLEDQMIKVAETQMDYQLATNLYVKGMGLLRTALGRGR